MDTLMALRVIMRWAHIGASVVWIGGGVFFWLALSPALKQTNQATWSSGLASAVRRRFRLITSISVGIIVATGLFETFDRLTSGNLGASYLAVLGAKLILAGGMYLIARRLSEEQPDEDEFDDLEPERLVPANSRLASLVVSPETMVILAGAVLLAASLLNLIYQSSLAGF